MFEVSEERAQRCMAIVAALKDAPYGTQLSYAELEAIMGADPRRRRGDILKARKVLLAEAGRYLDCVVDVGYRLIRPEEYESVIDGKRLGAYRRLKAGVAISATAPRHLLSAEENKRLTDQVVCLSRGMHTLGKRVGALEVHAETTAAQLAEVKARLNALERGLGGRQERAGEAVRALPAS